MSHSKITFKSKVDKSIVNTLLEHKYFITRDPLDQMELIREEPKSEIDKAILAILDTQNVDYSNNAVEYWFQYQTEGQKLTPHCDYNFKARENMSGMKDTDEFLMSVPKIEYYLSPITIATYLEVNNLVGGDLCISDTTCFHSVNTFHDIYTMPHERYTPVESESVHFNGSRHYHWIDTVIQGSRKSVLINLWPKDIIIY